MKSITLFFICFLSLSLVSIAQRTAVIKGTVIGIADKKVLPGAAVKCISSAGEIIVSETDKDGEFKIVNLPAGSYTIKVTYIGFKDYSQVVNLTEEEKLTLAIVLVDNASTLKSVSVFSRINGEKESSARSEEKNANNIVNVISAQAIQRSPDLNAANVLQRMSGVTLQKNSGADESYAIVRGLEPRYNNTLVNGVKIASPDEKSRYVSLDIVPADILQKIEVSKSLLPEMEGDAIGGTVNLVMKDAPDSALFKATASVGYNTLFLNRKYDYFSTKDIQQKSVYERNGAGYRAQPNDFTRSNLDFKSKTALPSVIAGITYGRRFLKNKLGFLIADNVQNQYYGTNSVLNSVVPDIYLNRPAISDISNRTFSTQQFNNGLTVHLDYNINERNKIILSNVLLNSSIQQARISIDTAIKGGNGGRTVPGTGPVTSDYTSVTSHEFIENIKLEGKHILAKHLQFDWAGVYSYAYKITPDRADLGLNKKIDTVHTSGDPNGTYKFVSTPDYFDQIPRVWQHNEDRDYSVLANLNYKNKWENVLIDIKAGGLYRDKSRNNRQDEYDLKPTTNSNGVKQVFTDIYSAQWIVYTPGGTYNYDVNNYRAFEKITAGYGQAKISTANLDVFGGVRVEKTEQGFDIKTFYPTQISSVRKNYTDVLPSIMVKYKLNNKTNIRASYFKSISRPNYYELVPYGIYNSSSSNIEKGNPDLKHAIANNFDIRYELFPKNEEQLFIGAFYKKIQDPIEYSYVNLDTYQPVNLGNATVYGAELAYTKFWGHWGLTGNYTYIYSKISSYKSFTDLQAGTTVNKLQDRPMQGQTNNTLNASLLYKNDQKKFFAQLAYQYLGKTLSRVYYIYGNDYYQQPQSSLSFSVEKQIKKHITLFGKFNNLLNTTTIYKIKDLTVGKDNFGASFYAGVRFSN